MTFLLVLILATLLWIGYTLSRMLIVQAAYVALCAQSVKAQLTEAKHDA